MAGGRCAGGCAAKRDHHEAAVHGTGSSAGRGADRGDRSTQRQCIHGIFPAGGRAEISPRRRPVDPNQERQRHGCRAGQSRADQALRPNLPEIPAKLPDRGGLSGCP